MRCRICKAEAEAFMTFGRMPLANGFLRPEDVASEYFYELKPVFCQECYTFQIEEQPEPESMFHDQYPFFTRSSASMVRHFSAYASWVREHHLHSADPFVVEIGSNDGTLLSNFADRRIRHLGIEPSSNVAEEARRHGVTTLSSFFDATVAAAVRGDEGGADVILAANAMCHIPDLHEIARAVEVLLEPEGVLIFEDPYLGDVLRKTSYDQIYDEHVYLFSGHSVSRIFGRFGLELIDVLAQPTHGGSMRYVLAREGGRPVSERVQKLLRREHEESIHLPERYAQFRQQCEASRESLVREIRRVRKQGARVVGYGATSKSTTVFNYCGVGPDMIEYICDTTPLKQGRLSPGVHIPVVPHERFSQHYPEYALLLAWNHRKEILSKEEAFVAAGGRWIVFVPEVMILP